MNGSGYRIGSRTQGGFSTVVVSAALALVVNSAFAILVMGGSTAGQRMYGSWNKEARTLLASVSGTQHKACEKS